MHETKSGNTLVLVDDHIPKFEDDEQLQKSEDLEENIMSKDNIVSNTNFNDSTIVRGENFKSSCECETDIDHEAKTEDCSSDFEEEAP